MQTYKVIVHEGSFSGMKWDSAVAKLRAMLDLGLCSGMEFDTVVPDAPPSPVIQTVEVKVRVYVCSACGKEFPSMKSLRGHLNRGMHRIELKA